MGGSGRAGSGAGAGAGAGSGAGAGRIGWWVAVAAYMGGIFWVSHQPTVPLPQSIPHLDKALHFMVYAGLGGLLSLAIGPGDASGRAGKSGKWSLAPRRFWLAWGIATLYGLSDEFHQSFVPGRDVSLLDWLADALGAAAGCWAAGRLMVCATARGWAQPRSGAGFR